MSMKRAVNYGLVKAVDMKQAILLLSFGTPCEKSDLVPYMTSIRHGKAPSEGELEVLAARYDAIGQWDNVNLQTMGEQQKKSLETLLGVEDIYLAYLHKPHSMEQAVKAIVDAGYTSILSIVTSPFYSVVGTGVYERKLQAILQEYSHISLDNIQSWWDRSQFIEYWSSRLANLNPTQADTICIFSAHSVPVTTVGDYVFHITSAAEKIAERVNLNHWCTAWQSAPPYGEWLGPTIETVIEQALLEGAKRIICVPFGFVSDHVEILYDNDILCRRIVEATGAVYERVPMPNGNALFMEGMAEAIKERINK